MGVKMKTRYKEFGFIRVNYNHRGITSWTLRLIPGLVSWNSYRRRWRIGLPGPFYYETKRQTTSNPFEWKQLRAA